MVKDTAPPHRYGPGHDIPATTHSIPIKSHPPGLTNRLLRAGESVSRPDYDESRPLIDIVQEASVLGDPGLYLIDNHYEFRQMLRKAKCFTLDAETSGMVSDLSLAIVHDLDTARQMALPPFPVTWFELDNEARLNRMAKRGILLTDTAAGNTEAGMPVPRIGWLIYEAAGEAGGYCASYFALLDEGLTMAPLSWFWRINGEYIFPAGYENTDPMIERLAFGVRGTNLQPCTYMVGGSPLQTMVPRGSEGFMLELAGELRHIFGLLVAISAGGSGLTMSSSDQAKPSGPNPMQPNGKPLLPLEHKHLHLHLAKRRKLDHVIKQVLTHHRMRQHDVRAHMRKLPSGRRVPVKSHVRGDKALGVVTKDYRVEK